MVARIKTVGLTFDQAIGSSEAEIREWVVETAKREHAKIMATDPQPSTFRRLVDGAEGAREESVRPGGFIRYFYPRLEMVAQYAMEVLFDLSPVESGAYRESHTLFLDGAAVPNLEGYRAGQQIMIANTAPYARKIEIGNMRMRVPGTHMVYQQAARIVRQRYGRLAGIYFTYRGIMNAPRTRAGRGGFSKKDLRYPVLIIEDF